MKCQIIDKFFLLSLFLVFSLNDIYAKENTTTTLMYPSKEIIGGGQNGNNNGKNTNTGEEEETRTNNFESTLNEALAQKMINSKDKFEKVLSETLNVEYLMQPVDRPLKAVDTLYVHPNFLTTILLPSKYKLHSGKASFKTDTFELQENSIILKPNKNFTTGNIIITATDYDKNITINIVLKKIETSLATFDMDYKKYIVDKNYLSLVYNYTEKKTLDNFVILKHYMKINGIENSQLKNIFAHDGDYDMVIYDGITYYLIRDDKYNVLNFAEVNLRISTEYSISTRSNKIEGLSNENIQN